MQRLLFHNEYHRLIEPVKALFGQDKLPPPPEVAPFCAIEEDEEGNIKGFLFLQLALHLEPFGSLDHASFSGLRAVIDEALTNIPGVVYYCHTDSLEGEAIFTSKGFTKVGTLLAGQPSSY